MVNLEFTPEELKSLEALLEHSVNELAVEMGHTDTHEFKKTLKDRKDTLEHLLQKVRGAVLAV